MTIGQYSFKKAISFFLCDFYNLQSLSIHSYSFSQSNGQFAIWNCTYLESIIFGDHVFENYFAPFNISNLNSLQHLSFGSYAFKYSSSLILSSLPNLTTITLGSYAFTQLLVFFFLLSQTWPLVSTHVAYLVKLLHPNACAFLC